MLVLNNLLTPNQKTQGMKFQEYIDNNKSRTARVSPVKSMKIYGNGSNNFRRQSLIEEECFAPNYVKMNKYNLNDLFTNIPKFDVPVMNFSSPQKEIGKGKDIAGIVTKAITGTKNNH